MPTADKAAQQRPATMNEIKTLISTDDSWTIGALMTIYQKQEADEQICGSTVHQNSVGFNGFDAPVLSDMARWYMSKGFLSEKQIAYIRRTIPKYIQQLMAFGVKPMDVKTTVDPKSNPTERPAAFMKVDLIDGKLAINFSFPKGDNRFGETLDKVKSLPSRRWIADQKRWEAPVSYDTLKSLLDWGFTFSNKAQEALDGFKAPKITLKQDIQLDERLFPYQKDGVIFLQGKDGSALIADEQGLGKTCQYLSWLDLNPAIRPALVICPASLKLNWEKEVKMWVKTHNKVYILEGKKPHELPKADIYIINYDILGDAKIDRKTMKPKPTGWCSVLADFGFKSICADEIQRIKSSDAQRSRASLYIAKHAERRCGLSGTPIKNKAVELFNPVNFVNSQIFPSFWRFTDEFTLKEHNGFGWQFKGVKNAEKLHQILTDTCFSYDTMIYTKNGIKLIGDIVENEIQTKVLSFNVKTGKIQWRSIIAHSSRPMPNKTLRIKHEFGELNCTPNHRIYTKEKGFTRAESLTNNLSLYLVQENQNKIINFNERNSKILFNPLRITTSRKHRQIKNKNGRKQMGGKERLNFPKNMPKLQSNNFEKGSKNTKRQELETNNILFQFLCGQMEMQTSNRKRFKWKGKNILKINRTKTNHYRTTDCGKKKTSNDIKRSSCSGYPKAKNVRWSKNQMVKNQSYRSYSSKMENFTMGQESSFEIKMADRVFRISNRNKKNCWAFPKRRKIFNLCRFSISRSEACYRGRWQFPQGEKTTSNRQMERKRIILSKVDFIEIHESTNRSKYTSGDIRNKVYDIQVEENENYFANGILVHNCMIRRKKDDVLKDLPPKTRATIPMAIKNGKEYDRVINDFKIWLHGTYRDKSGNIHSNANNPAARMVEMEKLKQATIAGKMDMCVEWIEDFLETEKKLVIFATHKETLDILQAKFGDICVRLDGNTGKKQRQEVVDRFQNDDKVTLFLGNIIAASEGITLTAASDVAFIEFPWCPAEVMQAEDRCHRIGQKDNVSCWYLVAAGTIEEPVVEMLQAKAKVLDQVLDGKSADDSSIFDELIEALK